MTDSEAGARRPVTSSIAGDVSGNVVQAANIHGDVYFQSPAAGFVVPRQLRPPPVHFINRAVELAELDRIADPDPARRGPVIAVITGQGGVGKSALASRWLADRSDDYPDGQLYVDLSSATGPPPMAHVLASLLRALGVATERIPVDVGEASALFRSVTAGKRLAVMLDNALSAAQVRTLLPASPASLVIVATRWRLGGLVMDGAGFIGLVPMATDDGVELLYRTLGANRAGQEPDDVARLAELCGGLPIALAIAGARLAMRPDLRVARMVRDLTDERRRLSGLTLEQELSVHGVFDLSYAALSQAESRAYRWLGLHPGPDFQADAAAATLAVPDAENVLGALVGASLLEVAGDRYRFHDLVRLHAREQAEREEPATERAAVLRRLLTHYLLLAARVDRLVIPLERQLGPVFRDVEPLADHTEAAALDELAAELPNVMALLRAGDDDLVWQLCEAMYAFFLYRKHFPDWIAAHRMGIEAAHRCGEQLVAARFHRRLGLAFHNLGQSAEAVEHGRTAVELARAVRDERATAEAVQLVGMATRELGSPDEAAAILVEAVTITARLGLVRDEAFARRALGQALAAARRFDEAVAQLRHSRECALNVPDPLVAANTAVWLVDALTRAGRPAEGLELVPEVWAVLRESGSSQYRAHLLMVWGEAAAAAGDIPTAREQLTLALDLYVEIGAPHADRVRRALTNLP